MKTKILNKIKHLLIPSWWAHRVLPAPLQLRIEQAIAASEQQHRGEIRFAAEAALPLATLTGGRTVRDRAVEVFSELRVWDTEENTGVLIYVQLIDRDFEIVADRGINGRVQQSEWDAIAQRMETAFRAGQFEAGVIAGLNEVSILLARHFPAGAVNPNELPDKPVVR